MKYYINRLTINGIKSIDKPIELLFTNRTIGKSFTFDNSNVKAIYGPNGSGKSGIITAMYIYKRLITDKDGISDKYFSRFILESINKKTKEFDIDIVFSLDYEEGLLKKCFRHHLVLEIVNDSVFIAKEEIFELRGNLIKDDNFKRLILVEYGALVEIDDINSFKLNDIYDDKVLISNLVYLHSLNTLQKHSISNVTIKVLDYIISNNDDKKNIDSTKAFGAMMNILYFTSNLVIELDKEDIHKEYIYNRIFEKELDDIFNRVKKTNEYFEKEKNERHLVNELFDFSIIERDEIEVKEFRNYKESVKKLTDFIRIFKPSLDEIIIDKKINDDKYYCKKIFRYGNQKIDIEFESTGIKKLVRLYSALKACSNGAIAFIDEIDANLHDVYFAKLIEFFKNDGKGQLCFTTHNLDPINILKSNNHAIDFISDDSRVYSWVKDGNKSAVQKYVKGLIPYSPFNVESFDFDILIEE